MARYKDCTHCGDRFRLDSQRKKRVGGKINECPDRDWETFLSQL